MVRLGLDVWFVLGLATQLPAQHQKMLHMAMENPLFGRVFRKFMASCRGVQLAMYDYRKGSSWFIPIFQGENQHVDVRG